MCGLIASKGKDNVARVLAQYDKQYMRGTDGFGFIALKGGKINAFKRATDEVGIRVELEKLKDVDTLLFHHRMPTSTPNVETSAHPIPVKFRDWKHNYYLLHNGIIQHSQLTVDEIRKTGYRFSTELREVTTHYSDVYKKFFYSPGEDSEVNDSEVLGFYIAQYLEGKREDIPALGSIAALVVQEDKKTNKCRVLAMRNHGNPLYFMRDLPSDGDVLLSSGWNDKATMIETGHVFLLGKHAMVDLGAKEIGQSYKERYLPTYSDAVGGSWRHDVGFDTRGQKAIEREEADMPLPLPPAASGEEPLVRQELDTLLAEEARTIEHYQEALVLAANCTSEEQREELLDDAEDARREMLDAIQAVEQCREENGLLGAYE